MEFLSEHAVLFYPINEMQRYANSGINGHYTAKNVLKLKISLPSICVFKYFFLSLHPKSDL